LRNIEKQKEEMFQVKPLEPAGLVTRKEVRLLANGNLKPKGAD